MSTAPRVGKVLRPVMTIPLRPIFVATQPDPMMTTIWMTPVGIVKRIAVKFVKPKSLRMRFPKVLIPPEAILS